MSHCDADSFTQAARRIASWRRPLLVTHEKPDGDALGSLVAMRALLQSQGLQPTALLFDSIPARYELFRRYPPMAILGRDVALERIPRPLSPPGGEGRVRGSQDALLEPFLQTPSPSQGEGRGEGSSGRRLSDPDVYDAVIVLDTCAYSQLRPIADWLRAAGQPKLAIDHHATRDDLAHVYLVDESAAATCLILYDFARAMNWPIGTDTAEALFVGMAMDTGWFRHSNTDHRVLAAAADLVARGIRSHELYESLFLRESPARVRLLGAALASMELIAGGQAAVMTLSTKATTDVGATPADTEDIVNEPLRIASVVVSVLLVEHDDGVIHASFRSKPPPGSCEAAPHKTHPDIDVAAVAQSFGGGGHRRAAGARIPGRLDDVRDEVVRCLLERLTSAADSDPC